mmetsp:Transcript_30328/g.63335  ORF Transcript_30328/g.63335 Transcript_30328/m.63335 type:complete len:500 (-) Transcript_30328:253-1752(-)|eukprot:CAMPEP_0172475240 /NCGR_PEP_ID=MMETSP1065-20121228/69767_1 /TAXON_ID=265537 /ORGANISM="Amphiprora paludosa, Strain CCMP125" /LENGTH=499 /DNA_ID=CAMNT_0013233437 /DNA_START=43 /DNA_END=1542 /DNA_ORIENTATION=-
MVKTSSEGALFLWWITILGILSQSSGFSTQQKIGNGAVPRECGEPYQFVILGGTGKIGTALAGHLLLRAPPDSKIVLVGRRKGEEAVQQVWKEHNLAQGRETSKYDEPDSSGDGRVTYALIDDVWDKTDEKLRDLVSGCDCLIHTAGPFLDRKPTPLELAMEMNCPVYIDISDPVAFLETSLLQSDKAKKSGTTALLAAGAFPGMSNVLAMEAAAGLESSRARDVRFAYFTAGLGGSGPLNLYITNLGFGEPMAQFDQGQLRFYTSLSGKLLGQVNFFLQESSAEMGFGNENARDRIGTRQVFAWPFPEAATVPTELGARGNSWACMGTAPELWNIMLGILVNIVPRPLWRNSTFSKFMADFSQPLVWLTDQILKITDSSKVGETHAMRIDVTEDSWGGDSGAERQGVSIVQAHDSFRQCVGQSCAEFALDCLQNPEPSVKMTEQRYNDHKTRARIISKLTTTPGTFCYTGPQKQKVLAPTNMKQAIHESEMEEMKARV